MEREHGFLRPELQEKKSAQKIVQYELAFDREKALELQRIGQTEPERYNEARQTFEGFLTMQLLTALGERHNVGISEYSYRIKEGKLVGEHSDEPFEDILARGRDYRLEHGNPIDHPREAAEVEGFKKMQVVMLDDKTPSGTIMISVSPPGQEGTIYKHNFYDMFQKQSNGSVKAVRFSSALTAVETMERLFTLAPAASYPEQITDVALLTHPIQLGDTLSMQQVHKLLHTGHDIMSLREFEQIKALSEILLTSYIATVIDEPTNEWKQALYFNAWLNGTDQVAEQIKLGQTGTVFEARKQKPISEDQIVSLGRLPVRSVDTGCGFSGGVALSGMDGPSALGAFGVSQFGSSNPEDDPNLCRCFGSKAHFHCPGSKIEKTKDEEGKEVKESVACQEKIMVGKGISSCPTCGEGKRC